jgi:hypothetical protein
MANYINEFKKGLSEKVAANMDRAIDDLLAVVKLDTKRNFLYSQKSRILGLAKFNQGSMEYEKYKTQGNLIQIALQNFISQLVEEDLSFAYSELGNLIRQFNIKKMNVINLVDCDRTKLTIDFWKPFYNLNASQFYFLPGCPNQHPDDFAERLIWEIIKTELEDEIEGAISLELEDKKTNGKPIKRIKFWDIPPFNHNRQIKRAVKDYFKERFYLQDEDVLNLHNLDKLISPYRYVVFTPRITEWTEFTSEFIKTLLDTFGELTSKKTTFIFFFVIESDEYHNIPNVEIENDINELLSNYQSCTSLIGSLNPVRINDIVLWFKQRGESDNIKLENLINLFKQKNNVIEDDHNLNILRMSHVRELQKIAFEICHNSQT